MKQFILFLIGISLLTSCDKDLPQSKSSNLNLEGRANKVTICHKLGNGNFISLTVSINALPAHLNHGDYIADADGDGYSVIGACTGTANDCDDTNPNIHPDSEEVCNDNIDNNCDGHVDEDCCPCTNTLPWQKTIGGNDVEALTMVIKTNDGGYFLAGYSKSSVSGEKDQASKGIEDYWVVKLDNSRNIQWQKTLGGSNFEELRYAIQTTDGGYLLGGWSTSDISGDKSENTIGPYGGGDYWIVKLDATGNIQWQKTLGGDSGEICTQILQTTDGGYFVVGNSTSGIYGNKTAPSRGSYDYWVLKLDASGNTVWQESYGGSDFDFINSAVQTSDGGYLLAGHSNSGISGNKTVDTKGGSDYWIVKINSTGSIQWQKSHGGTSEDYLRTVINTNDGGFFVSGTSNSGASADKTESSRGGYDYWVLKLNGSGDIQWQRTLGGSQEEDLFRSIQTSDNGFLLGGHSPSGISGDKSEASRGGIDNWIIKLTNSGNICWQRTIGGADGDGAITAFTFAFSVIEDSDKNYIVGGSSMSSNSGEKNEGSRGLWDYWVYKLTNCNCCE